MFRRLSMLNASAVLQKNKKKLATSKMISALAKDKALGLKAVWTKVPMFSLKPSVSRKSSPAKSVPTPRTTATTSMAITTKRSNSATLNKKVVNKNQKKINKVAAATKAVVKSAAKKMLSKSTRHTLRNNRRQALKVVHELQGEVAAAIADPTLAADIVEKLADEELKEEVMYYGESEETAQFVAVNEEKAPAAKSSFSNVVESTAALQRLNVGGFEQAVLFSSGNATDMRILFPSPSVFLPTIPQMEADLAEPVATPEEEDHKSKTASTVESEDDEVVEDSAMEEELTADTFTTESASVGWQQESDSFQSTYPAASDMAAEAASPFGQTVEVQSLLPKAEEMADLLLLD